MIKTQNNIASFVLRFTQELWRDAQGEPHVQWRGHIRHVQGDEEDRFTDFAEAVAFIQRYLTQLTLEALTGGQPMNQEKVLQESFKVWEQFAASYTDMMFETMQQTVKQSEAFREQFDQAAERALKAWQLSPQPQYGQLVEAINLLQAQVQTLTSKVEDLEKSLQAKTDQK
ncbi:MAG: energy transducer TonB [Anaerolineae bacterium]|nr:energy transducer TonB [Anaerolineae bacterium]